jgi:hypothetical protein
VARIAGWPERCQRGSGTHKVVDDDQPFKGKITFEGRLILNYHYFSATKCDGRIKCWRLLWKPIRLIRKPKPKIGK